MKIGRTTLLGQLQSSMIVTAAQALALALPLPSVSAAAYKYRP